MAVGALADAGFRCLTNQKIIPLGTTDNWKTPTGETLRHFKYADVVATRCGTQRELIVEVKAFHYPCFAAGAIEQVRHYGQCEAARNQSLARIFPDNLRFNMPAAPVLAIAMPTTPRHRQRIAGMCRDAGVHLIDLSGEVIIPDALLDAMVQP
jgi:hypothetical protein